MSSRRPLLAGLIEHECPRCHREVELPMGDLCAACLGEIERRARRVANLVALASTAVVAVYIVVRMPATEQARLVGVTAVVAWFVLSNMVVRRVMRQWTK